MVTCINVFVCSLKQDLRLTGVGASYVNIGCVSYAAEEIFL